jgi:DMSO/TMAO reductase YedYZ molybdopterin-dependent catalytic subunit
VTSLDRRAFLRLGGSSLAAALLAGCDAGGSRHTLEILRWVERRNEPVERLLFRHRSMDRAARAPLAGDALPRYYVSRSVPVWDERTRGPWALEVTGLVRRPLRLSLDTLKRLPSVTQRVNHYCVEGWTAVTEWTGVRVSTLAEAAGVLPAARYVDFQSFDSGYHESWDRESALHRQSLIAYGYDGRPLTPAHGAPARLHSPVKLGYKSTKYLTRIAFLPERNGGYWSNRGYEWYAGV